MSAYVVETLKSWGEKNLGTAEITDILKVMHVERSMSPVAIAKEVTNNGDATVASSIKYLLKKYEMFRPSRAKALEETVKELGYPSVAAFFGSPEIAAKSHTEIAKMLHCTRHNVWFHFKRTLNKIKDAG